MATWRISLRLRPPHHDEQASSGLSGRISRRIGFPYACRTDYFAGAGMRSRYPGRNSPRRWVTPASVVPFAVSRHLVTICPGKVKHKPSQSQSTTSPYKMYPCAIWRLPVRMSLPRFRIDGTATAAGRSFHRDSDALSFDALGRVCNDGICNLALDAAFFPFFSAQSFKYSHFVLLHQHADDIERARLLFARDQTGTRMTRQFALRQREADRPNLPYRRRSEETVHGDDQQIESL